MICLGLESTAHTFGCGIVDENCNILANEKKSYVTESGGIHPREAADLHYASAKTVVQQALEKANLKMKEIDIVSFSIGPGLGQCLQVGATAARALALGNKKPLLGVNHCVAHVEIAKKITNAKNAIFVYASGANTQIIGYEAGRYRIYGETLDIGIGNLLDSFGRNLGIGFPAGPKIDELYFQAKNYIELPYSVKGMDLVFAGLETAAERKIPKENKTDLAYSLMHTAFAELTEVSERALAHTEKKELVLTGGVAASKALRKMLDEMCNARGAKLLVPPFGVCTDNGAMIAWLGIVEHKAGIKQEISETRILPKQRTDDVEIIWHN
ncbi:MAG: KEOPS complex N(6)-L-threonylcarbamoyladenine synthase Kae1 [Candidatus ainarchaeum sp.]|nr:KEOPS complex N(6)-L-threonylcarbamoyladenine synthase Kae1 [Candidatus ainarchaeum sp.]